MSTYLSNIAERNGATSSQMVAPYTDIAQNAEPEIGIKYAEPFENIVTEKERDSVRKSQIISQSIENKEVTNNTSNYFSKNIYRNLLNSNIVNETLVSNKNETTHQNSITEIQKNELNNLTTIVKPQTNKYEYFSNQIFETSQLENLTEIKEKEHVRIEPDVNPIQKLEPSKKEESIIVKPQNELKNMLQPQQEAQITVKNEVITQTPKLVIGKINVEITPPQAIQQKIINRVVQQPQPVQNTKLSRLSFGLGQL